MTTKVELIGKVIEKPRVIATDKSSGCLVTVEIQNDIGVDFDVCDIIAIKGRRRWLWTVKPGTIIRAIGVFRHGKFRTDSCGQYRGEG